MFKYVVCIILILLALFYPIIFEGKTLFPANLLVSVYSPWKNVPLAEYPNGPPNKPIGFDNILQFYPNRKLLKESFSRTTVPLWNPYIFSGAPFMASFDTAVWYPLSWIASLMNPVDGWNLLVIIQPILSVCFMFVFLRSLTFDLKIALFGAVAYAFSGWMIVYWQEILVLEHSFLWLPLALYASNRLLERWSRYAFFLLIFSLTNSVFGGFLQMSMYVFIVVILWNVYSMYKIRKYNKEIVAGIVISLLITSIQIIPSTEAYVLSPRGNGDGFQIFNNGLLPLRHFITLIAPDFWGNPGAYNYFGGQGFYFEKMIYIGIVPLLFAIYGLIERSQSKSIFWKLLAVVSLSFGFALPTSWILYYLKIPVLSNSYPTRVFSLFTLSSVVLACYGIRSYLSNTKRMKANWILFVLTLIITFLWLFVTGLFGNQNDLFKTISLRNLILPTATIIALWLIFFIIKNKHWVFNILLVITIISSFYFARKYLFFSETRFIYPALPVINEINQMSNYDRVWGVGTAYIEKNIPQYFHWFSPDGYGNLSSMRYAELLSTITNEGKISSSIRRSDTDLFEIETTDELVKNPYRLRIMSLLGVKYVLQHKNNFDQLPSDMFSILWEDRNWRLWNYDKALPRVFFANKYIVKQSSQQIINALYDPGNQLSDTVILEEDPNIISTFSQKNASIVSYDLNSVTIQTQASDAGILVLTDNYYPDWIARIDGIKSKIYRADYSFRSVIVPKGNHTVQFSYEPKSFYVGAAISLLGIAGMLVMLLNKEK